MVLEYEEKQFFDHKYQIHEQFLGYQCQYRDGYGAEPDQIDVFDMLLRKYVLRRRRPLNDLSEDAVDTGMVRSTFKIV